MIQGKWKRKLYFNFFKIISLLNFAVPSKENVILFFSTSTLCDNSEALFHYLIEQGYNQKYKIFCAVRTPKKYEKKYDNIHYISVFLSIWPILRAKYVFYHNEMLPIMPTPKQIFVDFWHGSTVKKINKMIDPDYRYDFFTYLTVSSELFRPIFAEAFGCDEKKIILNGHPRNDYLYQSNNFLKLLNIERNFYKKCIIWAPTYRISKSHKQKDSISDHIAETGLPVFEKEEELEELNTLLEQWKCFLVIKIHPVQDTAVITKKSYSNIRLLFDPELEDKNIPFYSILSEMDALITDYSSILFDFLLLDRPMAFTIDDFDSYREKRGFVFQNPFDLMPGEYIRKSTDFFQFLQHCMDGEDLYWQKRKIVNDLVNFYQDEGNRRRILEFIGLYK